jgi:RNA polymerase sigma-70 factor (ECF subfamily)
MAIAERQSSRVLYGDELLGRLGPKTSNETRNCRGVKNLAIICARSHFPTPKSGGTGLLYICGTNDIHSFISVAAMIEEDHREVFARIFAQNYRWMCAYLMTMLGNAADVEEVFQEVCVVLWREYPKFDPTTNFKKWASVIARHKVMRFRTLNHRRAKQVPDEVLELIADEALEQSSVFEERREALHACLQKLPKSDRALVATCYADSNRSFRNVAQQLGISCHTVYKALQRARKALRECVERKMNARFNTAKDI